MVSNKCGVLVILVAAFLLTLLVPVTLGAATNTVTESSTEPSLDTMGRTTKKPSICRGNSPCGWAIYTPFKRVVTYFMQNTCVCPSDKKCYKTEDDLSVSAFVYRCRVPRAKTTPMPVPSS